MPKQHRVNCGVGEVVDDNEPEESTRRCCVCGGSWDIGVPTQNGFKLTVPDPLGRGYCWSCYDKSKEQR